MIKIAVCDDSSAMREIIHNFLDQYSFQRNIDFKVDEYELGESLLVEETKCENNHDLIFIDYDFEEKGENGIHTVEKLRKIHRDTKVIFVSGYSQVVFQSFEVGTYRFLLKPVDEMKLANALDDFLTSFVENRMLSICENGETYLYHENAISCIEGFGKNSIIHFVDRREDSISNETLSALQKRLSKSFFRCHKSFLINFAYVESYNHSEITLSCGHIADISRMKYKEFRDSLTDYIYHRREI